MKTSCWNTLLAGVLCWHSYYTIFSTLLIWSHFYLQSQFVLSYFPTLAKTNSCNFAWFSVHIWWLSLSINDILTLTWTYRILKIFKLKAIATHMLIQKSCSEKFRKIYKKTSTVVCYFSKVSGLAMHRIWYSDTTASDFPFQPLTGQKPKV